MSRKHNTTEIKQIFRRYIIIAGSMHIFYVFAVGITEVHCNLLIVAR